MNVARRRLLASGAAIVAMVALGACGVRPESTPRDIEAADRPIELTPTSEAPATTAPSGSPLVYLLDATELLRPARRDVDLAVGALVGALLDGPTQAERDGGSRSAIPVGTTLIGASVEGSTATIDLRIADSAPGLSGEEGIKAVAQLVFTATGVPGVDGVRISLEGAPTLVAIGDGSTPDRPVTRDDYLRLVS